MPDSRAALEVESVVKRYGDRVALDGDTASAKSQLDGFIERWKSEGVSAVFATGDEAVSKQFIEKLRQQMPNVTLLSDTYTVLMVAQEEKKANKVPNAVDPPQDDRRQGGGSI